MRRTISFLFAATLLVSCGKDEPTNNKPPALVDCSGSGIACVWAGTGAEGYNGDGKDRRATVLYWPLDVTVAADGTPYFVDWNNYLIRRVKADGLTVETVVGQPFPGDGPPVDPPDPPGDLTAAGADGPTVRLNHPTQILFAPSGEMYLDSWHNHKIRTWDPTTGKVHVLAGKGYGFSGDGGPLTTALFSQPKAVALGPNGELYILDQRNERIRKVDAGATPNINTVVGSGDQGWNGDDNPLLMTQLNFEKGPNPEPNGALALTKDGNTLYVADTDNNRIRLIDLTSGNISLVAGTGEVGTKAGPGVNAKDAQLNRPFGIGLDSKGNLFIADTVNDRILEVAP